jgi:prepilin-type processing-associated H-X9-DG protein
MRSSNLTLGAVLNSPDQYVIPVFQRYYRWDQPEWETLWDDLDELQQPGRTGRHFMGFLVLVPESVRLGQIAKCHLPRLRDAAPVQLPISRGERGSTGLRDMTDGASNTLLVAPALPAREIPWTKPEGIDVGREFPGLGRLGGIAAPYRARIGPAGGRAAPVLFADGSVSLLLDSVKTRDLAALITRAGGEAINREAIPSDPGTAPNPPYVRRRIGREGGRVRARIEPAGADRPDQERARPTPP